MAERPFIALDNGLTDIKPMGDKVRLLKELAYDGICISPNFNTKEFFDACDQQGISIAATYVALPAGKPIPDPLLKHIESLKGRSTIVWLAIQESEHGDDKAVMTIREVFDIAKKNGLRTALYPHVGFRSCTVKRCAELRQMADRPELGLGFTLCHFLAQNPDDKLEETIRSIAPHLMLVQINGANRIPVPKSDWGQLIRPLGDGNFDVGRVMRVLDEIGYEGPVTLQCYKVQQPAWKHLATSMKAWKALQIIKSE